MRERKLLCKVSVVYQMIVATWGTPWAVELLLLVYRYVSCCLSVSATLQPKLYTSRRAKRSHHGARLGPNTNAHLPTRAPP